MERPRGLGERGQGWGILGEWQGLTGRCEEWQGQRRQGDQVGFKNAWVADLTAHREADKLGAGAATAPSR